MNNQTNQQNSKNPKSNNGDEKTKEEKISTKKEISPTRWTKLEEIKVRRIGEKLASASISIVLAVVLIFGAGTKLSKSNARWFQFTSSLQQNDNSKNFSNHHYGKDMLKTAELNSILITEGGDNQVFGLLYFALAEYMRPDIDFFDQKGNVFPRLYGNFIGFNHNEVELIRFYRDFEIFSTGRPVYLTWQRKEMNQMHLAGLLQKKESIINKLNLQIADLKSKKQNTYYLNNIKQRLISKYQVHNLLALEYTFSSMISKKVFSGNFRSGGNLHQQAFKTFGPWYLKPIGLLYRVTPFHYAFADVLVDYGGKLDIERLFTITADRTKISRNTFNYNSYLAKLAAEGYVNIDSANSQVNLIKEVTFFNKKNDKSSGMTNLDYWGTYNFSFLNNPNATQWESLSRSIFNNYLTRYASVLTQHASLLRLYANKEKLVNGNSKLWETMMQTSTQHSESAYHLRSKLVDFSFDNANYLTSTAQVFKERKEYSKAINSYVTAAKANPRNSIGLNKANDIALQNIYPTLKTPAEKKELIQEIIARHYFQIERRKVYLNSTGTSKERIAEDKEIAGANAKIDSALKLLDTL